METKDKKQKRSYKVWTPEEDAVLVANYGNIQTVELAKMLGVEKKVLDRRVLRLGLKMTEEQVANLSGKRRWTEKEDTILKEEYRTSDLETLAKKLNRTVYSVTKRAEYLGVNKKNAKWTDESLKYLEENWGVITVDSIAKKFGFSTHQVRKKARSLNLGEESKANLNVLRPYDIAELTGQSLDKITNGLKYGHIKFRYYRVKNKKYRQITVNDFIEYLKDEKHCDLSNANISLIKPYLCKSVYATDTDVIVNLDTELLDYICDRVKRDRLKQEAKPKNHSKPWSLSEERKLKELVASGEYTHSQLCEIFSRPLNGIRGKLREFKMS